MRKNKTRTMILCALFAATTAALSQIALPLGPVPLNLATFSVLCAGALLGSKAGCISQIIYVLLGAAGAPVFSLFRGGPGVLVGPTGGYIVGYILAAWVVGFVTERSSNKTSFLALAMLAGFFAYMIPGTCWYMFSTHTGLAASLTACVLPFLPGDILKMAAATVLVKQLRPILCARRTGAL